jgi:hypothetical protein
MMNDFSPTETFKEVRMNQKKQTEKGIEALRQRIYRFVIRVVNWVKELPAHPDW